MFMDSRSWIDTVKPAAAQGLDQAGGLLLEAFRTHYAEQGLDRVRGFMLLQGQGIPDQGISEKGRTASIRRQAGVLLDGPSSARFLRVGHADQDSIVAGGLNFHIQ